MTHLDKAADMQAMLGQGQAFEALDKYYADHCVVVEANGETRNGREAQRAAMQEWFSSVTKLHSSGIGCITSDESGGITCVESWVEATFADGNRYKMEEVAVQKWENGKIVHERFYYNIPGQ
ncbi:MAG: nuclear transport factor 2 family protein [Saprospiraceae bacterium]|nr:nuclear transport factor 2 family protein [Saprospiraceae bacterium]